MPLIALLPRAGQWLYFPPLPFRRILDLYPSQGGPLPGAKKKFHFSSTVSLVQLS